jgi:hypothetical protein
METFDVRGPVAVHKRVAVGRCPGDPAHAKASARATHSFDGDGSATDQHGEPMVRGL